MSSVRMCDKCKTVFSELADGWQTFTATTRKRDQDGKPVSVQQVLDACPDCAMIPVNPVPTVETNGERVRLALEERVKELEGELEAKAAGAA